MNTFNNICLLTNNKPFTKSMSKVYIKIIWNSQKSPDLYTLT